MVEMIVRWAWNQKGLEDRKAFLPAPEERTDGYANLSYTIVNYQFLITENKMKIVSVSDYDTNNKRVGFFEGEDWQDIVKDSPNDRAKQAGLEWIKINEGGGNSTVPGA